MNYIRHKDWLGSSRLATTWAHAVYSKEAYAPFGETYYEAGTADRSFTGQDQDVATGPGGTGVYDFLFRKYDPSAGRWLSPDPAGWSAVNGADPQSLNRYAYVGNQPMNAIDPAGLTSIGIDDLSDVISNELVQDDDWLNWDFNDAFDDWGVDTDGPWVYKFADGSVTGAGTPNNGRNCSANPATAGQYIAATAQAAAMTAQFFSGAGPDNQTFGPGTATSQVMGQSAGVQDVLNAYYMTGQTSGLFGFGGAGYVSAGGNPVAQFVGSFRWSISGGMLSLTIDPAPSHCYAAA